MWTKNGKILMKAIMRSYAMKKFSSANADNVTLTLRRSDNTTVRLQDINIYYQFPQINNLNLFNCGVGNPQGGLILGNGTTPPTEDDYTIASTITLNNQNIQSLMSECYNDENGDVYVKLTYKYRNDTTQNLPVTISEFGLFTTFTNSSWSGYAMVYRDVFDEPITIAPGESKFITVTIKMSW